MYETQRLELHACMYIIYTYDIIPISGHPPVSSKWLRNVTFGSSYLHLRARTVRIHNHNRIPISDKFILTTNHDHAHTWSPQTTLQFIGIPLLRKQLITESGAELNVDRANGLFYESPTLSGRVFGVLSTLYYVHWFPF